VRQHLCGNSLASAVPLTRLAASQAQRHTMRWTDFCLLTSSLRAPVPRLVPDGSNGLSPVRAFGEIACVTAVRFALVGRTWLVCVHCGGRSCSRPRCVRTEPLASLSRAALLEHPLTRARTNGSRQDRSPDGSRERCRWVNGPRCLSSSKDLCPATPCRASGSGLSRTSRLGHRNALFSRPFTPSEILSNLLESQTPVHVPRAIGKPRFSEPWAALVDFCNRIRRTGTPYERSILARERSFRSATRRHQPMPVALAPRRVTASKTCEPQLWCTDVLTHAMSHLRGRKARLRVEALEPRCTARSLTISRAPFSSRLGHLSSSNRFVTKLGGFALRRLDHRSFSDAPREG